MTEALLDDERAGRRGWRLSVVGTFVSSLGSGLTLPFLFVYLHGVRHVPLALAGAVVAVGAIAAFALTPAVGALGDRIGLGRLLVLGLLAAGTGGVLLAFAGGAPTAFVAVAFESVGNSVLFPALNGLVAVQLPPAARTRAYAFRFGALNAGIGIGGLVSGSVVSLAHPVTFQIVYLLDGATTFVFAAIVLVGMRRTPGWRATARAGVEAGERARRSGYAAVLSDRRFVGFLACSFLFTLFGYAQLDGPWAAYATLVVGTGPRTVGTAFAVNTAVIVVCQLGVSRLTSRWRRSRMLAGAAVLWALAWLVTAAADLPALSGAAAAAALIVSLGVFGLGETLFAPVSGALPNDLAPEALRSRYNALGSAIWPTGSFLGPPLAGVLLGGPAPVAWVGVVVGGMLAATVGAVVIGRFLPSAVDRAVVE